ncbi:bifunctional diaminohydroxyphosphoribosylaminopyrimidine deaminase/5-amino-6-(5-phosphoribosylamino)uracil reductase RibD [Companilactobacillus zhachilii]|uniref:Riboflavin biosynthesis protein RibD n=1 Tax=Companilactobacillus zhachilii TaxID=2304606 RepID=A0A386PTW4_9LACO|nr:bifunctional diaminohydroxyphosphoribosylaminopyrimidine deaminase/5-amino-6-(5-phosphoribosylamino)uracil reductase RibD [Companilactobacillus zhachilii]AYE38289.1 bifunctional diaminohydroxyphosphoribosylaminopyrimidine deaminase/5-amino-6-(5-phosphoribosylamino)uracil reductase RibD [Companilactobacillus zhachilii]
MTDQQYLEIAINQAKKGLGQTWQNPLVGAVIVKNGQILAKGYHHRFGENHAEIDAISHLKNEKEAAGATIYVTLEPCSHQGKTPPCVNKIIELGFKRVVIGQIDPNPLVAGKSVERLKQHNIQVTNLDNSESLNPAYNFYFQNQRPLITLKYAMSLDGKINQKDGYRTMLTGKDTFQDTQKLRQMNQAILIGENTLKVDDPKLTIRSNPAFPPFRIVLIHNAQKLDLQQAIFQTKGPIYILTNHKNEQVLPENIHVLVDEVWTPRKIIDFLTQQGIQSLLIEGGSHIHADFVKSNLVDNLIVYIAPKLIGGTGLPSVWGPGISEMMNFKFKQITQLGSDIKISAKRVY